MNGKNNKEKKGERKMEKEIKAGDRVKVKGDIYKRENIMRRIGEMGTVKRISEWNGIKTYHTALDTDIGIYDFSHNNIEKVSA